jgi:hypothetical protein
LSDLEILFPTPYSVTVQGRRVLIKPVALCDFELFGKAAGELLGLLADPSNLRVMAYAANRANLRAILGKATDLSAYRVWRLPAVVAVELMAHVVAVNSGFFEKALVSLAQALVGPTPPNN